MDSLRVICLPGLGADCRLFQDVSPLLADPVCQEWIPARGKETLGEYSVAFAERVDLSEPFLVFGMSFGGMVALEAAMRHEGFARQCRGILSVASCRDKTAIDNAFKKRAQLLAYLPDSLLRLGLVTFSERFSPHDSLENRQRMFLRAMANECDLTFFRWAVQACANWDRLPWDGDQIDVPYWQVHGKNDDVIPIPVGHADETWEDGGHLLNYTHPEQIAQALERMAGAVGGRAIALDRVNI